MSLSRAPYLAIHAYQHTSNDATVRVTSLPQQGAVSSTLVQAALALVLAKYANSAEILLGIRPTGEHNSSTYQQQRQHGTAVSSVFPINIQIDPSEHVSHYLQRVHGQFERVRTSAEFRQPSTMNFDMMTGGDYNFQTVLTEQCWYGESGNKPDQTLNEVSHCFAEPLRFSNLDIQYSLVGNQANLQAYFDSTITAVAEIKALLDVWQHVMWQIGDNSNESLVSLIDYVPPSHMETLLQWNSDIPDAVDTCVHDLVYQRVLLQPDDPAICSWDGDFTYREVDLLSTSLANHLAQLSVGPDVFVAFCFDKSAWAIISVLAIMKAGGAFVGIDPKHPESRIKTILQAAGASMVLTSPSYSHLFDGLEAIQVDADFVQALSGPAQKAKPCLARSTDAAYMINTSGSTGIPKSIIIDHRALSSSIPGLAFMAHISPKSRVLQFSSYTFDVYIHDIFTTLSYGGCVCVPSEHERLNDLSAAIVRMEINTAALTPSVVQLLHPKDVPCLRQLSIGGEAFHHDLLERWAENVRLVNLYGPSECVIGSAATSALQVDSQPNNIGRGLRALHWIVDDEDHDRLCPIGCVGEILIEGPVLARGYTDPKQTRSSFIENPSWAKVESGRHRRFYKTGDMGKYNTDGTILFIGRRDSQVKVNGHRLELGEVEQHLTTYDSVNAAIAHFPSEGVYRQQLVAIITLNELCDPMDKSSQLEFLNDTAQDVTAAHIQKIKEYLSASIPAYMIPQVWIIVKSLPLNTAGKLDRSMVKRFLLDLKVPVNYSGHELTGHNNNNHEPSTDNGKRLQRLWAEVLGVAREIISADDNFFELGGNSLKAMRLVALARRENMVLTVADVFSDPVLADMATYADANELSRAADERSQLPVQTFELVGGEAAAHDTVEAASQLWNISWSRVQDMYPCTPLQAGLISLSAKNPGTYTLQNVFELSPNIDIGRFKEAWEACFCETAILRSVIIPSEQYGPCQIILKSRLDWQEADNLGAFLARDAQTHITYGSQLNRFALIQDNQYFVWTAHHASYDGVSMALILRRVEQIYSGGSSKESLSIASLVRHIRSADSEGSRAYWKSYLASVTSISFPRLTSAAYESLPDARYETKVPLRRKARTSITSPTMIRAAWALILGRYSESEDVIFGATLSGRTAPIQGIDEMVGPTATTVPLRIKIDYGEAVTSYLKRVQAESTAMMAFEHVGLQNIASLGSEYYAACNFQNLLVIQPPEVHQDLTLLGLERVAIRSNDLQEAQTYPLNIEIELTEPLLGVRVTYDSKIFTETQVSRMIGHLSHVIAQLGVESDQSIIGDIDLVSPHDLDEIQGWNARMPDQQTTTIPAQFLLSVERCDEAPAICAWDGEFTYGELDRASSKMAQFLASIGVATGVIVPVCFDKSAWAVVAILGILRAGGAYVSLDPAHPQTRLAGIIGDVQAAVIIAAPQHAGRFSSLPPRVVAFSPYFLEHLADLPTMLPLPPVSPASPAFILFTSGSTGKPKGIVIEHQAVCTSTNAFGTKWGVAYGTRVFQFAAYVFDVSVSDMFTALMRGACICIPSELDRLNNTAAAMNKLRANYVSLTPTVASLLKPEEVPGLRTLILGGEAPTLDNVRTWADKVDLIVCYGPAECSITCSSTEPASVDSDPSNIGLSLGSHMWIVDATDHNKLAPIGCVGEILVEGPVLARGYLNDEQKTAAAFIENPTFTTRFKSDGSRRFYKTGDLGYYNPRSDGSINFVGRKDTQVKVRGQRVELGEIEHHIYANPHIQHAVTAVPTSGPFKARLVAMLVVNEEATSSSSVDNSPPKSATQEEASHEQTSSQSSSRGISIQSSLSPQRTASYALEIGDYLLEKLPRYMIPSAFVFVESIPLNTSGKLNRQEVKAWIQAMDDETYHLVTEASQVETTNVPLTGAEKLLQQVCSHVLKLNLSLVRMGQSFLGLGGDSITAMLVVSRCRSEGMLVSVKDILQCKTLHRLATLLTPVEGPSVMGIQEQTTQSKPSDYQGKADSSHQTALWYRAKAHLGLSSITDIEAVYPCTPVQTGMLIAHARNSRFYEIKNVFEVKSMKPGVVVDADRLEQAWISVVKRQPVLRTVFFEDASTENIFHQAVIQGRITSVLRLESTDDEPIEMLFSRQTIDFEAPIPPNQFTICTTLSGRVFVKVDILHALSDGTTWDLIFKDLNQAYERSLSNKPPPSYADYVSYLISQPSHVALDYWKTYLAGVQPCLFPILGDAKPLDSTTRTINVKFDQGTKMRKFCTNYGVTVSNLIQTAWSLVLRSYVKCDHVCFGYVVSGRDVPLVGIDEAIGTYIGQLPCRVHIQDTDSAIEIARRLQNDYFGGLSNQHVSFVDLYHSLGITGQLFNTNVHYMRVSDLEAHKFSSLAFEYKRSIDPSEYDVTVHALVSDADIKLHVGYWDSALSELEAKHLTDLLSSTLMDILDNSADRLVGSFDHDPGESTTSSTPATQATHNGYASNETRCQTLEMPSMALEDELKKIWADILGIKPHHISLDAKFHGFGGDSYLIMKMVMATRESGFLLNFKDALSDITLSQMAAKLKSIDDITDYSLPTSPCGSCLLTDDVDVHSTDNENRASHTTDSTEVSIDKAPFGILLELAPDDFPSIRLLEDQPTERVEDTSPNVEFRGWEDVEDLLPTTLIQQAMLASQTRSELFYNSKVIWKVTGLPSSVGSHVFRACWQRVVDSHPILRTIFVKNKTGPDHGYNQLILKSVEANVEHMYADNEDEALRLLAGRPVIHCRTPQPAHALTLCDAGDSRLLCSLNISHALSDAVSLSIILKELSLRCGGDTSMILGSRPYNDLGCYITNHPRDVAEAYWTDYLKDAKTCHFPSSKGAIGRPNRITVQFERTSDLRRFTKSSGITASTIFRSAWALLLAGWTKGGDVCFGHVVSGRDAPVPGIENIVGPVLNILPCRVMIDPRTSVSELLEMVQADLFQSLPHQFWPLVRDKDTMRPASSMFNTLFNFRNSSISRPGDAAEAGFEALWSEDPMDYELVLAVNERDEQLEVELNYWNERLSRDTVSQVATELLGIVRDILCQNEV